MKAILCKEFGIPDKLVIENIPEPSVGENEVFVDVHSAAVNFPDTLIIQYKYQFNPTWR